MMRMQMAFALIIMMKLDDGPLRELCAGTAWGGHLGAGRRADDAATTWVC